MAHADLDLAIRCVEETWRWHGEGKVVMPPKITTDMAEMGLPSWFNSMPSYIQPLDMAGIKIVGGYLENPKHGLPFIKSNLVLLDPHNGRLRALMCGDWISDARTGAQPAIAISLSQRSSFSNSHTQNHLCIVFVSFVICRLPVSFRRSRPAPAGGRARFRGLSCLPA